MIPRFHNYCGTRIQTRHLSQCLLLQTTSLLRLVRGATVLMCIACCCAQLAKHCWSVGLPICFEQSVIMSGLAPEFFFFLASCLSEPAERENWFARCFEILEVHSFIVSSLCHVVRLCMLQSNRHPCSPVWLAIIQCRIIAARNAPATWECACWEARECKCD